MEFLPKNFVPQNYIHCMKCGKHFMFCACQRLGQSNLFYVMDPMPDDLTTMQRIQRWAQLVLFHPVLGVFDAPSFVNDLPPSFLDALRAAKPVVQRLMDDYKAKDNGLRAACQKLGSTSEDEFEQSCRDCDFVVEHFFKGNWGYPAHLEFIHLNNAIQAAPQSAFDPQMVANIQHVMNVYGMIDKIYSTLIGEGSLNFRLEDVRNMG
jgi:hypothetical protein